MSSVLHEREDLKTGKDIKVKVHWLFQTLLSDT